MISVKARYNESIDSLLKRFKKVVENSGVLSDLRKKEYFESPKVSGKKKHLAAVKRMEDQKKKQERFKKPRNLNFKWNRDHTKKIPLKNNKSNFNSYRK